MGAEKDVLIDILKHGLPKSEVQAQAMIDQLEGKKEEEEPQPQAQTSTRSSRST